MRLLNWIREKIFSRYQNLGLSGCVKFHVLGTGKIICLGPKSYLGIPVMGRISSGKDVTVLEVENGGLLQLEGVSIGRGSALAVKSNAKIRIGKGTYLSNNCLVSAQQSVEIGSDCAISWQVQIIDDQGHEIGGANPVDSVSIGDQVWIGARASILPGTKIGKGCVVAAGAVVKGVFPERCLIGGVPAKIIRENVQWKNPVRRE